jgi:hypothetical protein
MRERNAGESTRATDSAVESRPRLTVECFSHQNCATEKAPPEQRSIAGNPACGFHCMTFRRRRDQPYGQPSQRFCTQRRCHRHHSLVGHCATEKGIIPSEAPSSGTDFTIQ